MRMIDADALKQSHKQHLAMVHSDGYWVHGKELSRDYVGNICVRIHYDKYWCSECNYSVEGQPLWNYCPNCGAKMAEVFNETN